MTDKGIFWGRRVVALALVVVFVCMLVLFFAQGGRTFVSTSRPAETGISSNDCPCADFSTQSLAVTTTTTLAEEILPKPTLALTGLAEYGELERGSVNDVTEDYMWPCWARVSNNCDISQVGLDTWLVKKIGSCEKSKVRLINNTEFRSVLLAEFNSEKEAEEFCSKWGAECDEREWVWVVDPENLSVDDEPYYCEWNPDEDRYDCYVYRCVASGKE